MLFWMVLPAVAPPPLTLRLKTLALTAAEAATEVAVIVASSKASIFKLPEDVYTVDEFT